MTLGVEYTMSLARYFSAIITSILIYNIQIREIILKNNGGKGKIRNLYYVSNTIHSLIDQRIQNYHIDSFEI